MDENNHTNPTINNQVRSVNLTIILRLYQGIWDAVPVLFNDLTLPGKHSRMFVMRNGSHSAILGRKMLQNHQRRSLLRALRVSINTSIWMVMWRYPAIQAQPHISNICNADLFVSMVIKVNVNI